MKRLLSFIILLFLFGTSHSQEREEQTSAPLFDSLVVRVVDVLEIDGQMFDGVSVSLQAIPPHYNQIDNFVDYFSVRVVARNKKGKKVWKKLFKRAYLFEMRSGQVQVLKSDDENFVIAVIGKSSSSDKIVGKIREK